MPSVLKTCFSLSGSCIFSICYLLIFGFWALRFSLLGYRLTDGHLEGNIYQAFAILLWVLGFIACRRSKHWFDFFTISSAFVVGVAGIVAGGVGVLCAIDYTAEPVIARVKMPSGRVWFEVFDTEECQNRLVANRYVLNGHAIQFKILARVNRLDAPAVYLAPGKKQLIFESLGEPHTRRQFSTEWPCAEL